MKKYIFGFALASLTMMSCSEDMLDRINKDEASPTGDVVGAKFQITDAEVATAYSVVNGSYAWYVSSYTEQLFGTGNNQLRNVEQRNLGELAGATTFNNEWNAAYANLVNLKELIAKVSEGGRDEGANDLLGMAQILYALNWGLLTDLHGDIPFSESLTTGITAPKLDKQEDIYNAIFKLLDEAQDNLAKGGKNSDGQDLLFDGDLDAWSAFGHAVKARYLLHTQGRNPDVLSQVASEAQAAIDGGFSGAYLKFFNGITADNSWSAYHWSREYIGASTTVDNLMLERADPREALYNFPDTWATIYGSPVEGLVGEPGNMAQASLTETVNYPIWLENGAAPSIIFSEWEIYFILAEAKARLGQDATDELNTAVNLSIDYIAEISEEEVDAADVEAYLADVDALYEANPVSEILIQKYLAAVVGEVLETYNDIRRVRYADGSYPVALTNPNNNSGAGNRWPLRLPYGDSDVQSNPNIANAFGSGNDAGAYIFTENVWWAGGSR